MSIKLIIMNKVENKRLIAVFMNYMGGHPLTDGLVLTLYNDWNTIIPVVEACYEKQHFGNEYYEGIYYAIVDLSFQRVHNAVVSFIQWYNTTLEGDVESLQGSL